MDATREIFEAPGRTGRTRDGQADREQLQDTIEQLRTTVARLRAIQGEYDQLAETVWANIQAAQILRAEIDMTARRMGLSPVDTGTFPSLGPRRNGT